MINKSSLASVIVSVDGHIQFYNEPFQALINQRLNGIEVPPSIYALTESDNESRDQLAKFIEESMTKQEGVNALATKTKNYIEIRLPKVSDQVSSVNQNQDELKKLFFARYDIMRVKASEISFKAKDKSCVILNFTNISDGQA